MYGIVTHDLTATEVGNEALRQSQALLESPEPSLSQRMLAGDNLLKCIEVFLKSNQDGLNDFNDVLDQLTPYSVCLIQDTIGRSDVVDHGSTYPRRRLAQRILDFEIDFWD